MLNFKPVRKLFRSFQKNDDGNMGVLFAVTSVAVIGGIGAAMDFATHNTAKNRSQALADQTALSAAVFVKTHGRAPLPPVTVAEGEEQPEEEGYLDDEYRTYNAAELGYDFKGWVEGGSENVKVSVDYDSVKREARVTVKGKTVPTFLQVLGHENLDFESRATVKFEETDFNDPASVVMVLDNSNSMLRYDRPAIYNEETDELEEQEGAQTRISALRTHSLAFMSGLDALVGNQSKDEDKVLRTGMLAYASDVITNRTVPMDWQTQSTLGSLGNMVPSGGTNSAPPLNLARIWMSGEDKAHKDQHGKEPLKFMIFMTDGLNQNAFGTTWIPEEGTGQWRGTYCKRYYRKSPTECKKYDEDTVESETRPDYGYGWEEGYWVPTSNLQSLADCDRMKRDGVKIYTIGFALSEGYYYREDFDNYNYVDERLRAQVFGFLSGCASEPSTFLTAEDAEQLDQAFTRIGQDIETEIIRLAN